MHILTLELRDVTVSQAVLELHAALAGHRGPLAVHLGRDEMIASNLLKLCERQGRRATLSREGGRLHLQIAEGEPSAPEAGVREEVPPSRLAPLAVPVLPPPPDPKGVLLTRSRLGAANTPTGRRMLLGVLEQLPPGTPRLILALEALDLLEDQQGRAVLARLAERGIAVGLCRESLLFQGEGAGAFDVVPDGTWQRALAEDRLRILA